ncbi:hypothetical protein THRCLA_20632 [Thraustotheca clavata]|uniref:FAR-17a/AIG1-like protein n=1 Tax=Thraustotheca clavata TaxID=74557 RepID=A0A1W0A584_9STRA|nr:hypothetical protein THRCLA_20632 [Thraustotheca clavata]
MWEEIVVGAELGVCFLVCLWYIRRSSLGIEYAVLTLTPQPRRSLLRQTYCAFCLVFFFATLIFELVQTHGHGLAFYTCWNFVLQTLYWLWALFDIENISRHRKLLLDVVFSNSILVACVVWLILYPLAQKAHSIDVLLNWRSYIQHGINVPLLGIEFFWFESEPVLPMSNSGIAIIALFSISYAIAACIFHYAFKTGYWPYPFLELDTPYAPLWYALLLILHFIAFGFVKVISIVRHRRFKMNRVVSMDSSTAHLLDNDELVYV